MPMNIALRNQFVDTAFMSISNLLLQNQGVIRNVDINQIYDDAYAVDQVKPVVAGADLYACMHMLSVVPDYMQGSLQFAPFQPVPADASDAYLAKAKNPNAPLSPLLAAACRAYWHFHPVAAPAGAIMWRVCANVAPRRIHAIKAAICSQVFAGNLPSLAAVKFLAPGSNVKADSVVVGLTGAVAPQNEVDLLQDLFEDTDLAQPFNPLWNELNAGGEICFGTQPPEINGQGMSFGTYRCRVAARIYLDHQPTSSVQYRAAFAADAINYGFPYNDMWQQAPVAAPVLNTLDFG